MSYDTRYSVSTIGEFKVIKHPTCNHRFADDYNYCPECGKPRLQVTSLEEMIESFINEKNPGWLNPFGGACQWYEHDEDMREFSKLYPNTVFVLHGEGKENEDIWYKYYKNGKVQEEKAQITFGEFDENKLK